MPDLLGAEAYISLQPFSSTDTNGNKSYSFSKESINSTGVTAGFGQLGVHSFNLTYNLENPLPTNTQTEDSTFTRYRISKDLF